MRLLIIGDGVSQFINNFATSLKAVDNTISIDLLNVYPISTKQLISKVGDIYKSIFNEHPLIGLFEKIPKLGGLVRTFYSRKILKRVKHNVHNYDVIVLHGFWPRNCIIFQKVNLQKVFSLGVIWGSDFYKRGKNEALVFKTMDICDKVNMSTRDMIFDVSQVHNIAADKTRSCLFGLAPLQILFDNPDLTQPNAKRLLGLQENEFIITLGYCGRVDQQHLKIIGAIAEIKDRLPATYRLILPMTYGRENKEYQKQVKKLLVKERLQHTIYDYFMTDENVGHLRKATNIFIQTQKTDAFSGSMQEHLFAQSIVITGAWFPYQSLKEKDVYFETIDSMEFLSQKLSDVMDNYAEIHEVVKRKNTPEKFKGSLWSECMKDWYAALNEYKSHKK